jgi:AsmA protein
MRVLKWFLLVLGALIVLVIAALIIVPNFVDVQRFKPEIEKRVSAATGRPFTINGKLNLSLFPWAGLAFSDLHLGNPKGFESKDFVQIRTFEVRVKLLPLISRDVQVKRFVVEGLRVVMEKAKNGRGNWEGLMKPSGAATPASTPEEKGTAPSGGLPIKALAVGEFAVKDASLLWMDDSTGERKEVSDVNLELKDVSLNKVIRLSFSAKLDKKPISVEGKIGPVGMDPGKGTVPLDLVIKALGEMEMTIMGNITNPATQLHYDMALAIKPFSPRKLLGVLNPDLVIQTADPAALKSLAMSAKIQGDQKRVKISDGLLILDDSKMILSSDVGDFTGPKVSFDLNLDRMDVDRYLPPPSEKKPPEEQKPQPVPVAPPKPDYAALRKMVLDGKITIGELKVKGARVQEVLLKVSGRDGLFNLDPFSLKLYQGDLQTVGTLDVREDSPISRVTVTAKDISVQPLLKDVVQKDFLAGTVKAAVSIRMKGDDPQAIKKSLNGKGDLLFKDGAIVGIDLAGMVRNVKSAFLMEKTPTEKPRTDFSELNAPFTLTNGVFDTSGTTLASPLLRLLATGKADLVQETLDLRVEPKLVETLVGQGDTKQRGGIMVPILVGGTFSKPTFRPDLEGMLKKGLEEGLPKPSELEQMLKKGETQKGQEQKQSLKPQDLLKALPFGK